MPAEIMASLDAANAISIIFSSSLPYLVLPAPRTQTLFVMLVKSRECRNKNVRQGYNMFL
jgi:hypothetical protein